MLLFFLSFWGGGKKQKTTDKILLDFDVFLFFGKNPKGICLKGLFIYKH